MTSTRQLAPGANQLEVEAEILRLSARLEVATDDYAQLIQDEARADVAYKRGWAESILKSNEGTVAQREAQAVLKVSDLLVDRKISEAIATAQKELLVSLRSQLSALQTLSANIRAQV